MKKYEIKALIKFEYYNEQRDCFSVKIIDTIWCISAKNKNNAILELGKVKQEDLKWYIENITKNEYKKTYQEEIIEILQINQIK